MAVTHVRQCMAPTTTNPKVEKPPCVDGLLTYLISTRCLLHGFLNRRCPQMSGRPRALRSMLQKVPQEPQDVSGLQDKGTCKCCMMSIKVDGLCSSTCDELMSNVLFHSQTPRIHDIICAFKIDSHHIAAVSMPCSSHVCLHHITIADISM